MNIENWPRCPEAAKWFEEQFSTFVVANPPVGELATKFYEVAGVRLQNLVDHWVLPQSQSLTETLCALGLEPITMPEGDVIYRHPGARLPGVRMKSKRTIPLLALGVESIQRFAECNALRLDAVHGDSDSAYRCGHLTLGHGELMPIERNGYNGFAPATLSETEISNLATVRKMFMERDRTGAEVAVLQNAHRLAKAAISLVGRDRACDEFFAAERNYYLTRNHAARLQYARQRSLGFDWANHDHHTYRSTREGFRALIGLFVTLGFVTREKFYAGEEAGWGAQVLEHPISRVVIFADVDMAPAELNVEYATQDLTVRDTFGTIGLWCALHTSSIAEAGMHHLECEFDFTKADTLHRESGDGMMNPFTDLPMLKQAFTTAELWKVSPERVAPLIERGYVTAEQGERFVKIGAPGSHLEILQRWEGFKGFNKTGVSHIIRETDARN